jgi:hypothetical protein
MDQHSSVDPQLQSVLNFIESDGQITEEEFRSLARWLLANQESVANTAGKMLLERMVKQFSDGVISPDELTDLKQLIASIAATFQTPRSRDGSTFADEWMPVVGESHYRSEFVALFGASYDGADEQRIADLICEPENPYDHNAVAVWIHGHRVGYLSRDAAVKYHEQRGAVDCRCRAHITAGWDRGAADRGDYCVRLALSLRDVTY